MFLCPDTRWHLDLKGTGLEIKISFVHDIHMICAGLFLGTPFVKL
jgi:hypothetical protein